MAIEGAVEISGLDLPRYNPEEPWEGSRLGYPDQSSTLFLINDQSRDIEKNIRFNQISNIVSGVNADAGLYSGIVNRDFTGFSFDFKSLRSGNNSVRLTSHGATGHVLKIKPYIIASGYNLGLTVNDVSEDRIKEFGPVFSGLASLGDGIGALVFRSVTGAGEALVTGVLQGRRKQVDFGEDLSKRIAYTRYSGSSAVQGETLSLPWTEGQISPTEQLFSVSDQGAKIGFVTLQDDEPIRLDFSCDRVIFLDTIGYRGITENSSLNLIPTNLKVGTLITMVVFPRAPFENLSFYLDGEAIQSKAELNPYIFQMVGPHPFPYNTAERDFEKDNRKLQPVRMHFLCVKDTLSIQSQWWDQGSVYNPPDPSILVSFNDFTADFEWNTNLYLGNPESAASAWFGTTVGADTFPLNPTQYYPIRSFFVGFEYFLAGKSSTTYFSDNRGFLQAQGRDLGGPEGHKSLYGLAGLNNTFLLGSIDSDKHDLESSIFFTGYDYRYNNTGLDLP